MYRKAFQKVQKLIQSAITAFRECREAGIRTRAYAMLGHVGEEIRDMYKTIHFMKELRPDEVVFSLSSIYPGTVLAGQALKEGCISVNVWEERMVFGFGAPVYAPPGIDMQEFRGVMNAVVREFNLPKSNALRMWGVFCNSLF